MASISSAIKSKVSRLSSNREIRSPSRLERRRSGWNEAGRNLTPRSRFHITLVGRLEIRVDRVDRNTINSSRFLVISYMEQKLFWKSITRTGRIEISFDKGISAIFLNLNLFEIKKMERRKMFSSNAFLISTDLRIKSRNKKESALDLPGMRRISASVDSFIKRESRGREGLLFLWIFSIFLFFR